MNTLYIAINLHDENCDRYERITSRIRNLGEWLEVYAHFWIVRSELTADESAIRIGTALGKDDSAYIIDARSNLSRSVNLGWRVSQMIDQIKGNSPHGDKSKSL